MANKHRAAFEVEINGKGYSLRPTFEAVVEFNEVSGLDVFEALDFFSKNKKLTVKIIVSSIYAGLYGENLVHGRSTPSYKSVGDMCQSYGFANCMLAAIKFLQRGAASDETAKKLEEAEAEMMAQVKEENTEDP